MAFIETLVKVPLSSIREYPRAPDPNEGIGASIEYSERNLPLRGAVRKINWSPSMKKSTFGTNKRWS